MYSFTLAIVLESGALYPVVLIVLLIIDICSLSDEAPGIFGPSAPLSIGIATLVHIVGIAPTLIVVGIGLGGAFQDAITHPEIPMHVRKLPAEVGNPANTLNVQEDSGLED
ncbi:hypothetical protein V5O48_005417 [Marasmius crinis-equi]|uniref:Uncharacterized protein n=1 Tax=Marasmius crinis-equi TaxID=585013 RepID=A0ABR3FMU4_9AGAR